MPTVSGRVSTGSQSSTVQVTKGGRLGWATPKRSEDAAPEHRGLHSHGGPWEREIEDVLKKIRSKTTELSPKEQQAQRDGTAVRHLEPQGDRGLYRGSVRMRHLGLELRPEALNLPDRPDHHQ
jgi:hypothetical protein